MDLFLNKMKTSIAILSLLLNTLFSFSQKVKTDSLKSVTISEKKGQAPSSSQQIDSSVLPYYINTSLQHLLQLHSNVFIKNYGVGSLSTISIRGSSAAQTQVLWNGININNAMTGLSDFSALPVSFFDQINIEYGSDEKNPAMSGSVILSNDKPVFENGKKINVALGYESLQNYSASVGICASQKRPFNRLRLYAGESKNEFTFFNENKRTKDILQHARSKQLSLLNDYYFKLHTNNIISWHVWAQHQQREIPPAIFEEQSAKEETNTVFRTLLKWDRQRFRGYHLTSTIGFFFENYNYEDSLIHFTSNASVIQLPFEQTMSFAPHPNHLFLIKLSTNYAQLLLQKDADIHTAAFLASYSMEHLLKRINVKVSAQKEITNVFTVPFTANVTMNTNLLKGIKMYATLSSNTRTPTLNELYYNPGGNIDLKPEVSKSIEGGWQINKQHKFHSVHIDFALYNRHVKNWIVWYGSSILTPHNIQKVWSRGVEGMLNYEVSMFEVRGSRSADSSQNKIMEIKQRHDEAPNEHLTSHIGHRSSKFTIGLMYSYTLSTTEESAISNDYSIGKQIPYVPRYQLKGNIGFKINSFELSYLHTYTGYRFVTTDESQFLKPYYSGNLFASYKFVINKNNFQTTIRLNNLFNANYESIVGRVMPGRNLSMGLMWSL